MCCQKNKELIFDFIRYTQPAWLFNLQPAIEGDFASCHIPEEKIDPAFLDITYETLTARLADAGYRLWCKGVLLESNTNEIKNISAEKPGLQDEYIFIRKYWGNAWAYYTLLMRLFTFKNPVNEINYFFKTRHIKKIDVFDSPIMYPAYENFYSELIAATPKVAVIIPTLNRYTYLKDVLYDLEQQTYKNFEVLVFDQSDDFQPEFYTQFQLDIKVIRQVEKKLWTARNNAIKSTNASYLLFFDDDSRVGSNWISEHFKCIDFFNCDISAGVSLAVAGQKISKSYAYFRWADQFDSGNAMVKRDVFKKIGLFDEQFNGMRMGDGEFAYRAYLAGIKSISNYKASRVHLKVSSGGLREMGSWDGFRPIKWFAPKPVPSVLYLFKKYLPPHLCRNAILLGFLLSNIPYKQKRKSSMLMLSVILTFIKSPLLFIQYARSKKIALTMLKNDAGAEMLSQ